MPAVCTCWCACCRLVLAGGSVAATMRPKGTSLPCQALANRSATSTACCCAMFAARVTESSLWSCCSHGNMCCSRPRWYPSFRARAQVPGCRCSAWRSLRSSNQMRRAGKPGQAAEHNQQGECAREFRQVVLAGAAHWHEQLPHAHPLPTLAGKPRYYGAAQQHNLNLCKARVLHMQQTAMAAHTQIRHLPLPYGCAL